MSADEAVRNVIILEGAKLPERLRRAENPYFWALAVKKLLNKGVVGLYLKVSGKPPVQVEGPLAIEQLDLMVANHFLGECFPVTMETFSRSLLLTILPRDDWALVLRRED